MTARFTRRVRHASVSTFAALAVAACEAGGGLQGTVVHPPKELPAFEFAIADGGTYSTEPESGRPMVVIFGYTHCPDVCPTTLAEWKRVKTGLGADGARVRFLFVSVDRDRDTPAISQQYAARFDPSFTGVTGDSATIDRMQRAFGVASFHEHAAPPTAPGDSSRDSVPNSARYNVNHTTATFLLDDRGRMVSVHSPGSGWGALAANLERLL